MKEEKKETLIKCECGNLIFDGKVLKARFVHFDQGRAIAHCRRCKREVIVFGIKLVN